jgi:hypothetical protein
MFANWLVIMQNLSMWTCTPMPSSILRLQSFWNWFNLLLACHLSNVTKRLAQVFFALFTRATWSNIESTTFRNLVPHANLSFFMHIWWSWIPPLGTIFPNLILGGNYSPKVISHRFFTCKNNSIFIFSSVKIITIKFLNASNIKSRCRNYD